MGNALREDRLRQLTRGIRDALSAVDGYACLLQDDLPAAAKVAHQDAERIHTAVAQALAQVADLELFVDDERRASSRDPLTQVPNRRALIEIGERMFLEGASFSVLLIDVDKFKAINDKLGHAGGDAVLVGVAERCSKGLREADVLARLAGDEFVAILPNASTEVATRIAERLARQVASLPIATATGEANVTITLGAATRTSGDASFPDLITRADDAMYAAKRAGRNRVQVA